MDATAAIIEFALAKRGVDAFVVGNPDCVVQRVCAYREGAREAGILYVAEKAPHKKPTANSSFAILCPNPERAARDEGKRPSARKASANSRTTLLEDACEALRDIDLWDSKLKDALLDRAPLDEFIQLGAEMLACPIAYFDRNLITLAASADYWNVR